MKKDYVKPLIEKADFKFKEHIAASGTTPNYTGGKYNNNNSGECNWRTIGCNL